MKILFSECRSKTFLFDLIAEKLIEIGHEVFWIVQNKGYMPKNGNIYILKLPKKADFIPVRENCRSKFERVKLSDRMVKDHGISIDHYQFYWDQCENLINQICPDVVFGELSNFHTHFLSMMCEERGVLYLNPDTSRYPNGRFRFNKYDQCKAIDINDSLDQEESLSSIERKIKSGEMIPDYMKSKNRKKSILRTLKVKSNLLLHYISGERYTTPSPFSVFNNTRRRSRNIKKYERLCFKGNLESIRKTKILYPMQMQPEFNLDVWGSKWNRQYETILSISKVLSEDQVLVVKLNPKINLELSNELISLMGIENIIFLSSSVKMSDIKDLVDEVVTVTGTVAIERSIEGKRCFVFGDSDFVNIDGVVKVESAEDLMKKISVPASFFSDSNALGFLVRTSFPGWISEPLHSDDCLNPDNVRSIYEAFVKIIRYIEFNNLGNSNVSSSFSGSQ